jgi:acetyltransferase-like isoleucine patch superfamily enzyme
MKAVLKASLSAVFLCFALPLAVLSGFGRSRSIFLFGAHLVSLIPGLPGDYTRTAYYRLSLRSCAKHCRISFGAFFANPDAIVEDGVYIGPYCVIGRAHIGRGSQLATQVQILSGARQHARDASGRISGSEEGVFERISVGADCWIGAAAIVMADVGEKSTVGAGAIVTKPIPAGVVAVGNPARVIKSAQPDEVCPQ